MAWGRTPVDPEILRIQQRGAQDLARVQAEAAANLAEANAQAPVLRAEATTAASLRRETALIDAQARRELAGLEAGIRKDLAKAEGGAAKEIARARAMAQRWEAYYAGHGTRPGALGAVGRGLKKPFSLMKGAGKLAFVAAGVTTAAAILPNLKFGAKRGSANAEIDALREQAAASQEPQVLTAEQTMPMLPPMQAPMMGLPEGAAVGGDGASLMDQSPVPASKVASLGADKMPGGFMQKHNARQELGAAAPAIS